jgi:hypothetical protein
MSLPSLMPKASLNVPPRVPRLRTVNRAAVTDGVGTAPAGGEGLCGLVARHDTRESEGTECGAFHERAPS